MLITSNSSPASGELLEDGTVDVERMEFCNHLVPESSHTIEIQYMSSVPELHIYDSDTTIIEETVIEEGFDTQCEFITDQQTEVCYEYANEIASNDDLLQDVNDTSFQSSHSSNDSTFDYGDDCNSGETDLTNLNWLQNITNIMPVPSLAISPKPPPKPVIKNARLQKFKKTIVKCQEDFVKNFEVYKSDNTKKPPFSYCSLICLAMRHNDNMMTLSAIYNWIRENFKYYKDADPTWQNSIRHNLSLNKVFVKVARMKHEPGKGGFWKLDLGRLEDCRKYKRYISSPNSPKKIKQPKSPKVQTQKVNVEVQQEPIEGNQFDEMFYESKRASDAISDLSSNLPDFSLDSLDIVLENDFGPNVIVESVPAEEELGALLMTTPWEGLQPDLTDSLFDSYLK